MGFPAPILNQINMRAPKGIVYGPPGVGKTTFGAGSGGLIVDTENGAAHVSCDRTPYLPDWDSIEPWLDSLAIGGHEYGAVIVDSLDWLLRRAEEHVAGVDGTPSGMKQTLNRALGGYGNGKLVLKNYVYQYLLPTLDRMVNAGIAVILLAHTTRREITTIEWSDFVGAASMVGETRQLVLCETNQVLAKNRYGIRDPLPLSWPALMDAMASNTSFRSTP
jgi:energy-coupling factor transporter ATP-binding protein EcfA2